MTPIILGAAKDLGCDACVTNCVSFYFGVEEKFECLETCGCYEVTVSQQAQIYAFSADQLVGNEQSIGSFTYLALSAAGMACFYAGYKIVKSGKNENENEKYLLL